MSRMTTDAARKAVFNTSELLESILVCLPPKTLFGVQRVSKQFQAIIATSIPIQEKMFLRVRNKPQRSWQLKWEKRASGLTDYFVESANPSLVQDMRAPTELNPFLELWYPHMPCTERAGMSIGVEVKLTLARPVSLNKISNNTPSILNTYISDPPPPGNMTVNYAYCFPRGSLLVYRGMQAHEYGDGTIGDTIRNALEGDGRAVIRTRFEMAPYGAELSPDGESHPREVIEHYEQRSGPKAKLERGFKNVNLVLYGMVVPTDDERAAVRSRGMED